MGTFNDWRPDEHWLTPHSDGRWELEVAGARAGDEYLFVIDNRGGDEYNPGERGLRRVDPWARATRGASGNAVLVDVDAELIESGLETEHFVTPASADWLVYQVHVGSFIGGGDSVDTGPTGTGTFEQFEAKLGYIRTLGFNAIALLPIQENPGEGNEGYGPSHLFAIESSFGSPLALRRLVHAAHSAGLAVLFDVVWNHLSDFDNRLWNFDGMTRDGGVFFEGGERSPWGPRLAFWKKEVRDLIVDNARAWFAEYHVDGLRVDAANEIPREVLAAVVAAVRSEPEWQAKLLIAEWTGEDEPAWQALIDELGFDRVWSLADPYQFRVAMDEAQSAPARIQHLQQLVDVPDSGTRMRYLLGSHDNAHDNEGGARGGYRHFIELAGGRNDAVARAKARLGWALCAMLPGTPMCFMGTECHQPGYWHPRTDANPAHGDHRFDWSPCDDSLGIQMRALVAAANRIRWSHRSVRANSLTVVHVDRDNAVLAFLRPGGDGTEVLVVVNAGGTTWSDGGYRLPLAGHDGAWRTLLDSQAAEFGGERPAPGDAQQRGGTIELTLPSWSVVVLERTA